MREGKPHLHRIFVVFSISLFLVVFAVGSVVFVVAMQNIIRSNKGSELSQMLEIQRVKLENSINIEIAIVLKLADSPIIKRYFADPLDSEIKKIALEEIHGYRRAFSSFSIFWVNDIDMIFYSDDNDPYVVDASAPDNYWYNMTLYETKVYNFNINYNPDIQTAKLWINAPVFDETRKPIGMVGTGIELTNYVDMIYQSNENSFEIYLFNEHGEITGSKDIESVVAKRKIGEELSGIGFDILGEARNLRPGETLINDTSSGKVIVGTIPVLDWYAAAIAPVTIYDYDPIMIALFIVMFVVIALILVIFNAFIAGFLRSLRKTMESLEKASKAKSEFLATMSHEIRTPMNAILGITQIQIQKGDLPNEYAEALDKIYSSGNSLLGIINDILDMSKIESGKLELNPAEYDMPSLINDAVQLNIGRVGSKPVELMLDIDETLPARLCGDALRLKQILNNLLSNAIKYTDKGYVKLRIIHLKTEDKAVTLRIVVEDSGQGMKEEDRKRLFSEYLRFNIEANRRTEGTGLGLKITKNLVEMMNGTINIESEYGKGSIFTLTVRQEAVPCEAIGAELAERLSNFTFSSGKQLDKLQIIRSLMPYGSVLIVDDVETNLYVAEGLLSAYKLNVETLNSGFAAIDKVKTGKAYDVIFMDHMMPSMDGIETTKKLREAGYEGVIVALTANALVGNDAMFKQNGFDDFISKPIDIRQLNACLNKYVRDRLFRVTPEYFQKFLIVFFRLNPQSNHRLVLLGFLGVAVTDVFIQASVELAHIYRF
jgi:signal transduction histidine kinase/CheY-like chemotaxis protein